MELAGPEPELQLTEQEQVPVIRSDPYLADFTRLGHQVYLFTPAAAPIREIDDDDDDEAAEVPQQPQQQQEDAQPVPAPTPPDPDLIILCSWMSAQPRNIVKYTNVYRTRYPRARILLLRQDGGDFFFRAQTQQLRNLVPAVMLVKQLAAEKTKMAKNKNNKEDREADGDDGEWRVLMHIFSNGGSWTACQLADAYSQHQHQRDPAPHGPFSSSSSNSTDGRALLPITALVLDSTPSLPDMAAAHTAICESLPKTPAAARLLGSALVWGYLGAAAAVGAVTGAEPPTLSLRRRLNDPRGAFTAHRVPRVYIYSQADALIPAADVVLHAREAARVLGGDGDKVRLEDFVTSRHVGHVLADPDRYWGVIDKLWRESAS